MSGERHPHPNLVAEVLHSAGRAAAFASRARAALDSRAGPAAAPTRGTKPVNTASTTPATAAYDPSPDFVYAISLLAELEQAAVPAGYAHVMPFLGMARAELTDFGQHSPAGYLEVQVVEVRTGLNDLEQRLINLLATSTVLRQTLRIEAALRLLRRGTVAVA